MSTNLDSGASEHAVQARASGNDNVSYSSSTASSSDVGADRPFRGDDLEKGPSGSGTADNDDVALKLVKTFTNPASETEIAVNRRLSRILTSTEDEPDLIEVDYSDVPPMGGGRPYPKASFTR